MSFPREEFATVVCRGVLIARMLPELPPRMKVEWI